MRHCRAYGRLNLCCLDSSTGHGRSRARVYGIYVLREPCRPMAGWKCCKRWCAYNAVARQTMLRCALSDVDPAQPLSSVPRGSLFPRYSVYATHVPFAATATIHTETQKSAGRCAVYLIRGIAKRLIRNKQSTPTPWSNIDTPLPGVDIRQVEASFDCSLPRIIFGEFSNKG